MEAEREPRHPAAAEALNLFNHPQFAEPRFDLTSPNFGQITNPLNDGRAFRSTLQLTF